jgi:hypothetical protein
LTEDLIATVLTCRSLSLAAQALKPGSDLKCAFVASMLDWIDTGYRLGELAPTAGKLRLHSRP